MRPAASFDRPVLATERLRLRRPEMRDVAAIVRIVGQRDVAVRLSRVPHPYGAADARFFLDEVVAGEWCWAITLAGDDALIGAVGLTPGAEAGAAELGYWLSPDHWGSGIMTEAARCVLSYGFDTLRLTAITSGYFADNPGSGRVLEKIGFVETGRAMRPCLARGHDVASVEMRLPPGTMG